MCKQYLLNERIININSKSAYSVMYNLIVYILRMFFSCNPLYFKKRFYSFKNDFQIIFFKIFPEHILLISDLSF